MITSSAALTVDDPVLAAFSAEVGAEGLVAVEGARTRWELGGELTPGARLVHAPTGIVDYKPEEMTILVRAGTTVADLHATLAERGQRTGLPERGGTVGGALAVGENHMCALGRGRVRETLLQVRYVSAEGRIINSGGPTVKNVSGFDLPRLLVGSLGTIGLIAEVILRTNPIPTVSRWFVADAVDPMVTFDALLAPSVVLTNGTRTWVHLEGHGPDVDHQHDALRAIGSFTEVDGAPPLPPHRWSLSPADVVALGRDDPAGVDIGAFVATVGLGLVFGEKSQPAHVVDSAVATVAQRIKHLFDPTGRLNPGRDPAAK